MKIKYYLLLPLFLVCFMACNTFELPAGNTSATYSCKKVINDICSKQGRCVYPHADYVVFIDDSGYLFVTKQGAERSAYLGVGAIKKIVPYKNIFAAVTSRGSIYLWDNYRNMQDINSCDQIEFEDNDIVCTSYSTGGGGGFLGDDSSPSSSKVYALMLPSNCELKYNSMLGSFLCNGRSTQEFFTLLREEESTQFNLIRDAGQLYIQADSYRILYKELKGSASVLKKE